MKEKLCVYALAVAVLLSACGAAESPMEPSTSTSAATSEFTERELNPDYDENSSTIIKLNNESVSISEEGTYILSGVLDNGMVMVDTDKNSKVQLVLDGVDIHSDSSAAIYVKQADKVFITLAEGSENRLSNGGSFENIDENNIDAVIFSKDDLCFNGSGSLNIASPADHGIVCKDSLAITAGCYNIEAASHAIACKEDIAITAAVFDINSGKDGIHAENADDSSLASIYIESGSFSISSEGDGISADALLNIDGGSFEITAGGGSVNAEDKNSDIMGGFVPGGRGPGHGGPGFPMMEQQSEQETEDSVSRKAIKAAGDVVITEGSFKLNSADDAVHSNVSITVNGGNFNIATGDDAFHADDTLTVNAGNINISESYEGLEALHLIIAGGDISLAASDDGLNAAGGTDQSGVGGGERFGPPGMSVNSDGSIVISGGKLHIKASGDGIDANGTLEISGGDTVVCAPTRGDTAVMDYDVSATISSGSFVGTGAYGMAQSFGESEQGVIAVSVGNCAAGTIIKVSDSDGKELLSYTPELDFAIAIISNEQIKKGESYTLNVGELSGEIEAY